MKRLMQLTTALLGISAAATSQAVVVPPSNSGYSNPYGSSYYHNNYWAKKDYNELGKQSSKMDEQSELLKQIMANIQAMGNFMGYDLTSKSIPAPSQQALSAIGSYAVSFLMMYPTKQYNPYAAYTTLAISAAAASTSFNPSNPMFAPFGDNFIINQFADANNVFTLPPFNGDSSSSGTIGINLLVDQPSQTASSTGTTNKGYQPDPTSQAIQNLFTTPDISLCLAYSQGKVTSLTKNCPENVKSMQKLMINTTGSTPDVMSKFVKEDSPLSELFKGKTGYFDQFYPLLNANNLLSPLIYSSSSNAKGTSKNQNEDGPIAAASQAQQAQNFIRFASGQLMPLGSPNAETLETLSQNMASGGTTQQEALYSWAQYVSNVTTYAAQASVVYSNLNTMMAKRMPMTLSSAGSGDNNQGTKTAAASQALYEYQMATWRLNDSTKQTSPAWLDSVVKASPATVAKEQLALLAEINYQLYLNRQMQERQLLTSSMMLMQQMQVNRNMLTLTAGSTNQTGANSFTGSSSSN